MGLEEEFSEALEDWRKHCINVFKGASHGLYLNCEAYRKIISMRLSVLPLIRKAYDTGPPLKSQINSSEQYSLKDIFEVVIIELANSFKMPKRWRMKPASREKYTKTWLDENIDKYLKK
jgi:hypothetical protein